MSRVIITGAKGRCTYGDIKIAVALSEFQITELVSGGEGLDLLAERYARERRMTINRYIPNKESWPKAHYKIRNGCMTCYADALIFINTLTASCPIADEILFDMKELRKPIYLYDV